MSEPLPGALILVVDDEADMLGTLRRVLERRGHQVITAATRQRGLESIETLAPALVVADLRLPDGSGLDIVRAARQASWRPPVVVVTGFASNQNRLEALQAGATAYLSKPFSLTAFTDLVERLLAQRSDGAAGA